MEQKQVNILITGASSGIGEATAKMFAQQISACRLILVGRRKERLEALKQQIQNISSSCDVLLVMLDIRDKWEVENKLGHNPDFSPEEVDVLINNAGLAAGADPLVDGSLDHWERMIDTNLKGLLYVSRIIVPAMKKRGQGHVINLSSVAGKDAYACGNVYCATKYGVEALTKSMRQELVPYGVKVSSIAPGAVNTEFSKVRYDGDERKAKRVYDGYDPLMAEDVAKCILFIATAPKNVNIADLTVLPLSQADSRLIDKK